jgi:GT2 family glycosyltransferase
VEKEEFMVSVIVPTYNRPEMLVEAIKSILEQTFGDCEIIVVNDAGPDVSGIVEDLNKENNITCVRHSVNRGLAAARNTGIKLSRGEYIAYLDDDDIFYPDHLGTLVNYLEGSDHEIAYTDAHRAHQVKEKDKYITTKIDLPYSQDFDYDKILVTNFVPVLCFMHKKECLEKTGLFDESLPVLEDWDLWIRMSRIYKMPHIRKVTAEFRARNDGTSMSSQGAETFYRTGRLVQNKYWKYATDKPHVQEAQDQGYILHTFELLKRDSPAAVDDLNNRIKEASKLISESKFSQAIDKYADIVKDHPDIEIFYRVLCDLYSEDGRSDIPKEWVTGALTFDPGYSESLIEMCSRLVKEKKYEDAGKVLSAVIEVCPDNRNASERLNAIRSEGFNVKEENKNANKQQDKSEDITKGLVSIIIPVVNKVEYTRQCLQALSSNTDYDPYEVIIIDNGSTDETKNFLGCLEGDVKIITNEKNLGFAIACNQGAREAEGEYLVFLNNDTIPQPRWLENLVKVAQERTDVAVVGSKLIYPDNKIQHAGVAFGSRGSKIFIYHIYNGIERDHPAVNNIREFNAVTAACMLVKRNIYFALGMFDEVFKNGYEDVDFCLRVRGEGHKIIYNPESVLYHYEETTEGRHSYGEHNTRHFLYKWKGKIKADDESIAREDGFSIEYDPDTQIRTFS